MLCQFERLIYPQKTAAVQTNSYMIAIYRPCETIRDTAGNTITQVKAVGYCLPTADTIRYELQGHWSKNPKHGVQFEVENYDEVIIPTKEGIIAYLTSGQIKGIGPKLAERIYQAYGNASLDVLDKEPEKLLSISGISEGKLKKICDSYLANRGARDVVAFLSPHGITPNRAVRLYREYGEETMEIVKKHPYRLCEIAGIGFKTADKIAMSMGFDKLSTERVDEGMLYTMTEAETKGHLCLEKHEFIKECQKTLDTPQLTEEMLANRALRLLYDNQLVSYKGNVYRQKTAQAEQQLAEMIIRKLKLCQVRTYSDLDAELDKEERLLNLKLAPEQRDAVKVALSNGVAVITGGPGTGKTLIQRAILDIYRRKNPGKEICCCAPTGRAARRMEESTGFSSSTVHKALGLMAGEDDEYDGLAMLDADLILADEISMLDIFLAANLFRAVNAGSQVILVGDAEQLPSVGPGAVLREIIASNCIPVVRLDKVFRQNKGSRIAINAKLIRHGNLSLEYGADFQFVDSANIQESADIIVRLYKEEISKYGIDNVALLTPYRQRTETGVNSMNERLQELVNPPSESKKEIDAGKRKFRTGDKVMQIKNHEDVSNGDVGYITRISTNGDETTIHVDFGDGKIMEYDSSELDMLDLGYASTVHKSQGSEYKSVILNLQCAHHIMLNRALVYTAITRGKEKVTIVGERKALCIAIKRTDAEKRGTCLGIRMQEFK